VPAAPGPAIVVQRLTKRYGEHLAVDDISFEVRTGEVFAFLGQNGAGKTTTVEIIETIRPPTSGTVTVLGMDVTKRKRDIVPRIGVLPQGFSSFDKITVRETIQYYARLFSRAHADIDGLINLANLGGKRDDQFRNLSGGLKQRLGIAIALVNDPEVLFLDEPTASLDPDIADKVRTALKRLQREQGVSIVYTSHNMREVEILCDRVLFISRGKAVAQGSPREVVERANGASLEEVFIAIARDGELRDTAAASE